MDAKIVFLAMIQHKKRQYNVAIGMINLNGLNSTKTAPDGYAMAVG